MNKPTILPAEEIYNFLMQKIEPELTTNNLQNLPEKYAHEAEQEKALRLERYEVAYKKYDETYLLYIQDLSQKVSTYRKHAFKSAEAASQREEDALLNNLENVFLS